MSETGWGFPPDVVDLHAPPARDLGHPLGALAAKLGRAPDASQVARVVAEEAAPAAGAVFSNVAVWRTSQPFVRLTHHHRLDREVAGRWSRLPVHAPTPITEALRSGEAVLIRSLEDLERWYPHMVQDTVRSGLAATASLPASGATTGLQVAVGFGWDTPQDFPSPQLDLLRTVADMCGSAFERAVAFQQRERALEVLSLAQKVGMSGSWEWILEEGTMFWTEGSSDLLGLDRSDPAPSLPDLPTLHPADRPRLAEAFRRALVEQDEWWYEFRIVHPVRGERWIETQATVQRDPGGNPVRMIGINSDVTERKRRELSLRRMYEMEREAVLAFQRSLLPAALPDVSGLEVEARYEPASARPSLGGDWYDVIPLEGRRIGLAVGDVVGSGPSAAAAMGQVRSALGALSLTSPSPREVVERLDGFAERIAGAAVSTLVFAVLDRATRSLTFSRAGHPPPLLVPPTGHAHFLEGGGGPPIGVAPGRARERSLVLPPRSTLVLYTDGLVERRGLPLDAGLDDLRLVAEATRGLPLREQAERIREDLVERTKRDDDVALLLVRLAGDGGLSPGR